MYKNFNITESEKEQILNRLKENGYKQPTNKKVISEERNFSLDDIQNHFHVIVKNGSNVVLRRKKIENTVYSILKRVIGLTGTNHHSMNRIFHFIPQNPKIILY